MLGIAEQVVHVPEHGKKCLQLFQLQWAAGLFSACGGKTVSCVKFQGVSDIAPPELQSAYYSFCVGSSHVNNLKALDTEHPASFFEMQLLEEEARLRTKLLAVCRELNSCLARQYSLACAVFGAEKE